MPEDRKVFGITDTSAKPGGLSFPSLIEIVYLELSGR
jgi:hypothetical protein